MRRSEMFGDPPKVERIHGYAAGQIRFAEMGPVIQFWPRIASKNESGWEFHPDVKRGAKEALNGATEPAFIGHRRGQQMTDPCFGVEDCRT